MHVKKKGSRYLSLFMILCSEDEELSLSFNHKLRILFQGFLMLHLNLETGK
jgi:hypothetical protein